MWATEPTQGQVLDTAHYDQALVQINFNPTSTPPFAPPPTAAVFAPRTVVPLGVAHFEPLFDDKDRGGALVGPLPMGRCVLGQFVVIPLTCFSIVSLQLIRLHLKIRSSPQTQPPSLFTNPASSGNSGIIISTRQFKTFTSSVRHRPSGCQKVSLRVQRTFGLVFLSMVRHNLT